MARDLVVIEASGKLRGTHQCLAALGYEASVVATLGHLYDYPPDLRDIALAWQDGELVETDRRSARPTSFTYLCDQLKACTGRLVLATDDDAEGHVIAGDVAALALTLGCRVPAMRVLPHALTPDGWRSALDHAKPWDPALASAGTARRIADRLIAAVFSDPDKGRVVGRVQSALLGLAERQAIPSERVTMRCPAEDGQGDFVATVAWASSATRGAALSAVPVASQGAEPLTQPWHGGDALLALNDQLQLPIEDVSELLQAMYEAGDISYPRSPARGLRAAGAEAIAMLARKKGVRPFHVEALPRLPETEGPAHEAIHLQPGALMDHLDLGLPLRLCRDRREAAATVIARHDIECGVTVASARPVVERLPAWAQDLPWKREGRAPVLPWRRSLAMDGPLDTRAALVEAQMHYGVGRPSTWASHAVRLDTTQWLNPDGTPSVLGRLQLRVVPPTLRDPTTARTIETILQDAQTSVTQRVLDVMRLAFDGDGSAVDRLLDSLASDEVADELPTPFPAF
ncbi:MAG: hypothetical protein ACREPQ_00955 [Rhodanobacter sp.]